MELGKTLLRGLSPNLRRLLKQPSVKLISRLYAGFDTEYVTKEYGSAKLVSYQLAVSSRLLIKCLNVEDRLDVNELMLATGEKVLTETRLSGNPSVIALQEVLNDLISTVRSGYDRRVYEFIEELDTLHSLGLLHKSTTDKWLNYTVLKEPSNRIPSDQTYLEFVSNLSLNDVVKRIKDIGVPLLKEDWRELSHILKGETLVLSESHILKGETLVLSESSSLLSLISDCECEVESEVESKVESNPPLIRETHVLNPRLNDIFKSLELYLMAHMSSADLSLLSDFDSFKHEVDLIHKNFVTLGRPYV
ncbi:hypothetical protein BC937DRAFT_88866, partial [Endogone sp. FLAS-F59071]